MGIEIDRERFGDADYTHFTQRLEQCLRALEQLLERPGFGEGPRTIGAELELFLIDGHGRPLAKNQAILEDADDPRLTLELDRFNLEVNPSPSSLAGQPFTGLGRELEGALESVRATAAAHHGRVAMVGILPTLRDQDLQRGAITDAPRYRALDWSLRRVRAEPFEIEIQGRDPEPLRVVRDNIVMEGANTSFQVHLRVDPADYVAAFNAAQLATAPALAAAGNSPLFLGRVLWEETRIALFEQAADDRDAPARERLVSRVAFGTDWLRGSVLDLFEEGVRHHEPLLPIRGDQDPLAGLADRGRHAGQRGLPARPDPGPGPRRRRLDRPAAVRPGPRQLLRRGPPGPGGRADLARPGRRPRAGRGRRAGAAPAPHRPARPGHCRGR